MLKHRLPTGAALIALAIGLAWTDGWVESQWHLRGLALALIALPIIGLAAAELSVMLRESGARISSALGVGSAVAGFLIGAAAAMAPVDTPTVTIITPLIAAWLLATLVAVSWPKRTDGALLGMGAAALTLVYLGLIPAYYLVLRQHVTAWALIAVILIVKSSDIGAYFTGRLIGRHKLIPWLSPGKTWEGLVGGMAFAALVAVGVSTLGGSLIDFPLAPLQAAVMGAALALIGPCGDLTISLFKRDSGLKDSSGALPGLGGVLDVVDSLIFAAPAAHWLIIALS